MLMALSVKDQSIETSGITRDYKEALCEYIWNGFEANASEIRISYTLNATQGIDMLSVHDNGSGISYEEIEDTFGAFLASKKNALSLKYKSKSNKGKGRFSFIALSSDVEWLTTYQNKNGIFEYKISLSNLNKEVFECTTPTCVNDKMTGTTVSFIGIDSLTQKHLSMENLELFLLKEFSWFLYLNRKKSFKIYINGDELNYSKCIDGKLSQEINMKIDKYTFNINLVVWTEHIKEKFCCYFFDSSDVIKGSDTTTFNRNTIDFNHSVYIKSLFFDNFDEVCYSNNDMQIQLEKEEETQKILRQLKKVVQDLIAKTLDGFMLLKADEIITEMIEERKTFPVFSNDPYAQLRKRDLISVTKEIYCFEPKIFYKLKEIQEKSLLAFLNLLLSSEERENILAIMEQIVELSPSQRERFAQILKKTKLENIIDTIEFIENRYKVIEILKTIVYDLTKFSNERNHIQKIIENHFWLFGEQFHLASADQRMQKALEKYLNILYGERNVPIELDENEEAERRMDVFMCSSRVVENSFQTSLEENIVIELKAPTVPLSKKVLRQIEDYMDFVIKQPRFNSQVRRWKFIAVCREVDQDVKNRYKAFEDKGKPGLVSQVEQYEVYAMTWDDVFKSFDLRHSFMLDRLKYDRDFLLKEINQSISDESDRQMVNNLTKTAVSL